MIVVMRVDFRIIRVAAHLLRFQRNNLSLFLLVEVAILRSSQIKLICHWGVLKIDKMFGMLESIDEAGSGTEARFLESKLRISIYFSNLIDTLLFVLSSRRKDEKLEAVDAPEVEDQHKSSFKCKVAESRWSSNNFSSKSMTIRRVFKKEDMCR